MTHLSSSLIAQLTGQELSGEPTQQQCINALYKGYSNARISRFVGIPPMIANPKKVFENWILCLKATHHFSKKGYITWNNSEVEKFIRESLLAFSTFNNRWLLITHSIPPTASSSVLESEILNIDSKIMKKNDNSLDTIDDLCLDNDNLNTSEVFDFTIKPMSSSGLPEFETNIPKPTPDWVFPRVIEWCQFCFQCVSLALLDKSFKSRKQLIGSLGYFLIRNKPSFKCLSFLNILFKPETGFISCFQALNDNDLNFSSDKILVKYSNPVPSLKNVISTCFSPEMAKKLY